MYCNYCGSSNPDDSVYCSKCGRKLKPPSEQAKAQPNRPSATDPSQTAEIPYSGANATPDTGEVFHREYERMNDDELTQLQDAYQKLSVAIPLGLQHELKRRAGRLDARARTEMPRPEDRDQGSRVSNPPSIAASSLGRSLVTAEIRISDLPEVSKSRLLSALKNPPHKTFVINESKLGWALIGLVGTAFAIWGVLEAADNYRWQSEQKIGYIAVAIVSFIIGWQSAAYLYLWLRHAFKAQVLINPLYLLRFHFNRIEAFPLPGQNAWSVKHLKDSKGAYSGTKFYFTSEAGQQRILKTTSVRTANDLIEGLNSFPEYVSDLIQRQDTNTLHLFDLLFEWRAQGSQQSLNVPFRRPTGLAFIFKKLGPASLAGLLGVIAFFAVLEPYNDYRDDELRWDGAKSSGTASGYRLYIASRPDGRHVSDAHATIATLYERAADKYRTASGVRTSEGVEAVIKMLEYASRTGHYKVLVDFAGNNEIPTDIEQELARDNGVSRLIPIQPSFTASMNQARETRILQKITESFGKVIPGDILQFGPGRASSQEIGFKINYVIQASGAMYYPEKQENVPQPQRDWYTGIAFDWNFFVRVPGAESSNFQLTLKSEPAQHFYSRGAGEGAGLAPTEVYNAMADSAFDDFGSKLLSQLALR